MSDLRRDARTVQLLPIASVDFYHSGHNDIALVEVGFFGCCATLTLFKNQGNGTFVKALQQPAPGMDGRTIAVDVNGDGMPDLVTWPISFTLSFAVLLNKGDGTFAAPVYYDTLYTTNETPLSIALADFDGNGHLDVDAYTRGNPSQILILRGKGDGTVGLPTTVIPIQGNYNPGPLLAADLDGNGTLDLLPCSLLRAISDQRQTWILVAPGLPDPGVVRIVGRGH